MSGEEGFEEQLVQEAKDYLAARSEKGIDDKPLTADMIPEELKEACGLSAFPEEIQNTILKLGQQLTDYALTAVPGAGEKGFGRSGPSWSTRASSCLSTMPSGSIMRDAWKAQSRMGTLGGWAGKLSPAVRRYALPLRIGAFGATSLGAATGHFVGCMRSKFR